jgi:flagellar basal-body rod protein FlgG
MLRALNTAATGMEAQQLRIDIIANNLANVNTTGFKRSRGDFQDLLYQTLRAPGLAAASGRELPTGLQVGLGTRPVATLKVFTLGELRQTGSPLDLAVEGNGFFQIRQPNNEIAYTRAGAFRTDRQGRIVTADGYLLEPGLTLPPDAQNVVIAPDGTVSVQQPNQKDAVEVGKIQLVSFVNPAGLESIGRNLYRPSMASGEPIPGTPGENGLGTVAQGFLEGANVKVVDEMIEMIVAQRTYEINSKVIQAADQVLQKMSNIR